MSGIRRQQELRYLWILLVTLGTFLGSCNVREPGCLDIEAANFDFEADRNDQSLCVYPNLVLNVAYDWADTSLHTGFLYQNSFGMDFAIHGVQILFSGFNVQNAVGEDLNVDQRVQITTGSCDSGSSVEIPDDFVFTDRSAFNYAIGAFRKSGLMNQFRFTVGVPDAYTPLCLELLPVNHKLTTSRAGYDEAMGEFALGRFIVSRDSVNAVRDTIFAYGPSEEWEFDVLRTFTQGKPDTLYMAIDFFSIFDGVDLSKDPGEVGEALASRIGASVTVQ